MSDDVFIPGTGYIELIGWTDGDSDKGTGRAFRAIVVFPAGPPAGLPWTVVWDKTPVTIITARPSDALGLHDKRTTPHDP